MSNRLDFLELGDGWWRLSDPTSAIELDAGTFAPREPLPEVEATRISERLVECGGPRRLIVGLSTELLFASPLTLAAPRDFRRRDALQFRLEERLPLAAEEMVTGFWRMGTQVLAVVVPRSSIEPSLAALNSAGLSIECVTPTSMLWFSEQRHRLPGDDSLHVLTHSSRVESELFLLRQGMVLEWVPLSASTDFDRQVDYWRLQRGEEISPLDSANTCSDEATFASPAVDPNVLTAVQRIASGAESPLVSFELAGVRGSVGSLRSEWLQLAAVLVIGLLGLAGWNLQRSLAASALLAKQDAELQVIYQEVFPSARPTTAVERRMRIERDQLAGARGHLLPRESGESAVHLLHKLLASLPTELRTRVLEVRCESGRLAISGEARAHGDADRIAAALRGEGLEVRPPTTQRLATEGVEFRITAASKSPAREPTP